MNNQLETELRQANEEWTEALAQRDRGRLEAIMAEDFVFAYPFEGDDKDQFIAAVVGGEVRVETLEAVNSTLRTFGTVGLIFGNETANWNYRGRDLSGPYRFIRVFARIQNRWQVAAIHLCSPSHR